MIETPIDWEDYQRLSDSFRWNSYQLLLAEIERLRGSMKTLAIRSESVCVCEELREAEAAEELNEPA